MRDPVVFELSKKHWDVMYYSTITLVLIKASTTEAEFGISGKCLEAARAGLQSHLTCFSSYQTNSPGLVSESDYASWSVPLVPYHFYSSLTADLSTGCYISHHCTHSLPFFFMLLLLIMAWRMSVFWTGWWLSWKGSLGYQVHAKTFSRSAQRSPASRESWPKHG